MLVYLGSCAHWLGLLAAMLGRRDVASAHFEAALEMNARLGARPALGRTCYAYGRMLLRRDADDSAAPSRAQVNHGRTLIREAVTHATEARMQGLLHDALQLAD